MASVICALQSSKSAQNAAKHSSNVSNVKRDSMYPMGNVNHVQKDAIRALHRTIVRNAKLGILLL